MRWSRFKDKDSREIFLTMQQRVFPAIKKMKYGRLPDFDANGELVEIADDPTRPDEGNTAFARYMDDAMFLIPTPQVLQKIITGLEDLYTHDIAALKLGAASAEGVDIDPVAVRTAGENAALNGVQDKLTVLVGDLSDKASGTYDIITANIVANAILSLAPAVPGLMAEGATFIASGIIDSRKDEVIAGLEKAGLSVVEVKEKRGWECIVCKKA